jgi:hypothetical protein
MQWLIFNSSKGHMEAVRTLLNGSVGSVARFINGTNEVRETLYFPLLLMLFLPPLQLRLLVLQTFE